MYNNNAEEREINYRCVSHTKQDSAVGFVSLKAAVAQNRI
jgi:hypothetical protein